ncbi:hypothetical protein FACS1894123_11310 [Bacteroidia bacterium]|nr:hypothetical protein FACS1894123_11310 [Bacteroidia bacterium]
MEQNESARQTVVQAPETYVAPAIEIIEVEVEKGFAQSIEPPSNPRER